MILLLDIILAPLLFFITQWLLWALFEKTSWPPRFLAYKPFNCLTCATFWTQLTIAVALAIMAVPTTAILLAVLAVLNAIARKIDEREHTVKLSDLNDENDDV